MIDHPMAQQPQSEKREANFSSSAAQPATTRAEDDSKMMIPEFRPYKEFQKEFKLGRVLGRGSFGVVQKCRHKKTKVSYAVKTVPASDKRVVKFEAAILADPKLRHNHIVQWHKAYRDEENVYLVMEYCAGGDANAYMDRVAFKGDEDLTAMLGHLGLDTNPYCQPLEPEQIECRVGIVLSQILCAVRHCHDVVGIAHRDIKPENILLKDYQDEDPHAQLIDFGLARRLHDETNPSSSSRVGTVLYAAPEVMDKRKRSDDLKAADMWSIGAVAFMFLYGRPPFMGEDENETKQQVCEAPLEFPEMPCYSDEAKDFVRMLLDRDPTRRPTAFQALRHQWLRPHLNQRTPSTKESKEANSGSCSSFGSTISTDACNSGKSHKSKPGLLKSLFSFRGHKSGKKTTHQDVAAPVAMQ